MAAKVIFVVIEVNYRQVRNNEIRREVFKEIALRANTILLERNDGYAERIGKVRDIVTASQTELLALRTLAIRIPELRPIHAIEVGDMANGRIAIDQGQVIGYAVAEP